VTETGYELSIAQLQALGDEQSPVQRTITVTCPISAGQQSGSMTDRFRELIRRHDILRTSFVRPAGLNRRLQSVADPANDDAANPMLSLSTTDTHLALTAPAAIADERSLLLLLAELVGNRQTEPDPLQFVDYASWEQEQLDDDGADAKIARAYWTSALRDDAPSEDYSLPVLDVTPLEVPGGFELPADRWLASFASVLQRQLPSEREHVVVALAASGRTDAELESAIGPYERFVPLVVAADPTATIDDVVSRVRADAAAADRFAVFAPPPVTEAAFAVRAADATPGRGGFPLELTVTADRATIWYAPAVVDARRAEFLAAQLARFVEATIAEPAGAVAAIDIVGAAEAALLAELLTGEAASELPDPTQSVTAVVGRFIASRPDALAVVCGADQLSYGELGARAQAIAGALGTPDAPVAILLEHSTDSVAAAFGVLLSGVAYLPLDVSSPPAFWAEQLAASGTNTVVTDRRHTGLPASVRTVVVDDLPGEGIAPPAPWPGPAGAGTTAYLIFTSGSTGAPKPVAVTHGNVLAYTSGVATRLGLDDRVRFAAVTGMSTDLGNTAVFGALLTGGTLEIVPADMVTDGPALSKLLAEHEITAMKITPSHLRALLAGGDVALPLELLVIGGEALDGDLAAHARAAGARRIVNHYGPTETTIGVFTYELPDPAPAMVPIGRPLPQARARVLDTLGRPAPFGAVGELVVGGPCVSAGYLGRPEQTAERFVADPVQPGRLAYRTGDLVRVLPDGAVVFVGRADGQVKIRGFRVELGEIEARLRDDDSVAQAAVIAEDGELYAFVVPAAGPVDIQAVRQRLAGQVPPHLVPARLAALDSLPLTPSGKLDRRRLLAREDSPESRRIVKEPRNDIEAGLVEIWLEVLPVTAVGIDDNFFQIGGHSLLATKVIARSRARFGVDLPLHVIFASPTVEAMAIEIGGRLTSSDDDLSALLDELDSLSDDEAAQLLASESAHPGDDA
jgi:amino acid adenylation domain-containing protein